MTDVNSLSFFWAKLAALAEVEPEPQVRQFFQMILELENDKETNQLLITVLNKRTEILYGHLAYLLWSAFQYVTDLSYTDTKREITEDRIKADLRRYHLEISQICLHNNVNASHISRYSALQIVLAILQRHNSSLKWVVDLGTSVGLGLLALNTRLVRRLSVGNPQLSELLSQEILVDNLVGVDLMSTAEIDWKWLDACISPSTQEFDGFADLEEVHNWLLKNGMPVQIVNFDFLDVSRLSLDIPYNSVDVIWTSNVLYQISADPKEGSRLLSSMASRFLQPQGIWINADYGSWSKEFGGSSNHYDVNVRINPYFDKPYHILEAPDDRVTTLYTGKDFQHFITDIETILTQTDNGSNYVFYNDGRWERR